MTNLLEKPDYIKAYQAMLEAAARPKEQALEAQRQAAEQEAKQASDRAGAALALQKTQLPAQMAALGLLGTGEAETSLIDLNAAHQNTLKEIETQRLQALGRIDLAQAELGAEVQADVQKELADFYLANAKAQAQTKLPAKDMGTSSSKQQETAQEDKTDAKPEKDEDPMLQSLYTQLDKVFFGEKGGRKTAYNYLKSLGFLEEDAERILDKRYGSALDTARRQGKVYLEPAPYPTQGVHSMELTQAYILLNEQMRALYAGYLSDELDAGEYLRRLAEVRGTAARVEKLYGEE